MLDVIIAGGGISGLATAFALIQENPDLQVLVLEPSEDCGGTIGHITRDGFTLETGPNGFLSNRMDIRNLAVELGLEDDLVRAADRAQKRFTVARGRLDAVPTSPISLLRSRAMGFTGWMRVFAEPFVRRGPPEGDESIYDFVSRRIGAQAASRLIDPMVNGIFAGDPKKLSVYSTFPKMVRLEQDFGGLVRGALGVMKARRKSGTKPEPTRLMTVKGGMSRLVGALVERLGDRVQTGRRVSAVRTGAEGWEVTASSEANGAGEQLYSCRQLVLATPAYVAADLLAPHSQALADELNDIIYAPVCVVGLGFAREQVQHPLDGFGFVIAGEEDEPLLGCVFTSSLFDDRAPTGHVLLRCMIGGSRNREGAARPDDELVKVAQEALGRLVGASGDPLFAHVVRWDRAIPQYELGHGDRLDRIRTHLETLPSVTLTGNAYRGISLDDCAREARRTAEAVLNAL